MENLFSMLGSFASIAAAIWAFIEAKKAAKAATKAEKLRNEMIDRRKLVEVSMVHVRTDQILTVVSKIGPSCNPKKLKGIDCAGIAKEVEEYARFLNEQSSNFSNDFINKAENLCQDLNKDIEELSEATDQNLIKDIGKRIYYKINGFMPFVKNLADAKREVPHQI